MNLFSYVSPKYCISEWYRMVNLYTFFFDAGIFTQKKTSTLKMKISIFITGKHCLKIKNKYLFLTKYVLTYT